MKAEKIWFDNDNIFVKTNENKVGKMPLKWFPRLNKATIEQRENYELWADNTWIHWEFLKEDLSIEGFFEYKK